jgi:D-tyrosyl-tRNA(Tyr) deacylase
LVQKILGLRIFSDPEGKMNCSLDEVNGEVLLISQFTLFASTKKGNRPSYIDAAPPSMAIPLYEKFIEVIQVSLGSRLKTGIFGADMKVSLINDGPVTIQIDSKNKA